jgi:methyltransferase (TIGR00027 family)
MQILCLCKKACRSMTLTTTASDTSLMPMVIAAVEHRLPPDRRVLADELAIAMLPAVVRPLVRAPAVGRRLKAAVDSDAPGVWNGIACRKRYIDDQVSDAVRGLIEMVVLGAGLDTRAARLAAPAGVRALELDLPVNIARKRRRTPAPDATTLVPIELESQDVAAVLAAHGRRADFASMVVWEGVTQYLTADGVRSTLQALAHEPAGSRLVFSYVRRKFLDGDELYGSAALHRRFAESGVWRFGLRPPEVAPLLVEYGWRVVEDVGAAEYAERYLSPAGRADGATPRRALRLRGEAVTPIAQAVA